MLNQTFKIVYVEYKPSYTTIPDVIQIHPIYGNQDGSYLLYTSVAGIERKWNHDIEGNELYIRVIDFGQYAGFRNIEKIIIVPEEDIKKFVIQRTDHEDLVINVNGGTYRDE